MLTSLIGRVLDLSTRYAWVVVVATAVLAGSSTWYAAQHFSINTDVNALLSSNLSWHNRDLAYRAAFPQQAEAILVLVQGPTPELAGAAANALTSRLQPQTSLFRSVSEEGAGEFFERNALLYVSAGELEQMTQKLEGAASLLQVMASDPSLRGLGQALSLALEGVKVGRISLNDMTRPLNAASDTLESIFSGRPASFSWKELVDERASGPDALGRVVNVWPILDYRAVQPGAAATAAIRAAVREAKLEADFGSTALITGPVAITDQELATLREGAWLNAGLSGAIVFSILWLALRSFRIVAAVLLTIAAGLACTAALGLLLVGAFNPISVAFAVLFVGLGADFAIQFSVRYRSERHVNDDVGHALISAGKRVGAPLTLAAGAAAAGFLSFLPTSYSGLAQLGLIAGCGMVIAYGFCMTLLPALLRALNPPGEPKPLGYAGLAFADRFLQRHRIAVIAATAIVTLAGLPSLAHLQFDFDPLNLQGTASEAVAGLRVLSQDSRFSLSSAEVLTAPSEVAAISKQLSGLPQVATVRSLDSFVPDDQDRKLSLLRTAASRLIPALTAPAKAAPSDAESVAALRNTAKSLAEAAAERDNPGAAAATRLAGDLDRLADGTLLPRQKAETVFVTPLEIDFQGLRRALNPQRVTASSLPPDLVREWSAPDGRLRVEAVAKGGRNSNLLRQFALSVLAVQPTATGQAIETYEWGRTIMAAFVQAGAWALCAIAILLWLVLRRIRDVFLTIIPLMVAAALTLEICALTDFPLNYANIIALPVLLGIGVAFKIYYVMAWRHGEYNFLESPLTHAVFFSALTTATAFGSLWSSKNPGISSMGKLLALSLLCTLASAALFQPALMGPPRKSKMVPESQ